MYRIAWFSSRKENSTSALFTRLIVPSLKERADIVLFSEGEGPDYLAAFKENFDLHIYNFEDGKHANFVRSHLGLIPGLAIFHDFFLTSDGPEPILNSPWEETVRKYQNTKRQWANRLDEFKRERPHAFREAGLSFAAVFTDERSRSECGRVIELSLGDVKRHSYYLPFPAISSVNWRFEANRRVVAFQGSTRIEHRAHKLLPAIPKDAKFLWMIDESEIGEATRLIKEAGVADFDLRLGRSPEVWDGILRESSCACLPLFSVYGHLHPYLEMSLLAGVPTVVTRFGTTEYLSQKIVFQVAPGDHETAEFKEVLTVILNGEFSQSLTENVHTFARETYSPSTIASELYSIVEREMPHVRECRKKWDALVALAREEVLSEAKSLVDSRWNSEESFREIGWLK